MADLAVMLNVRGRRCLVVGGGPVAARRVGALVAAGAEVTVVAPDIDEQLAAIQVKLERRAYNSGDLDGVWLVVVATDDSAVNVRIAEQARAQGVLINRTDEPETSDITIPAHATHGPVTIAVHTGGISASAAAAIRRQLSESLDPDWPRLLETVAPYRQRIQQTVPDPTERQNRLRRLTDETAMNILKTQGIEALQQHCEKIATNA